MWLHGTLNNLGFAQKHSIYIVDDNRDSLRGGGDRGDRTENAAVLSVW